MTLILVTAAIALSLIFGAPAGRFLRIPERVMGNIMAFGGGVLLSSLLLELFVPAIESARALAACDALLGGAAVFAVIDHAVDLTWRGSGGLALPAAIALDGVPENLAVGVETAGGGGLAAVGAFAVPLFLSTLPESAARGDDMRRESWSRRSILGLRRLCAAMLSAVTLVGAQVFAGASERATGVITAFGAGAVAASLVTEVFPQAHREDDDFTGVASALGLICAALLSRRAAKAGARRPRIR